MYHNSEQVLLPCFQAGGDAVLSPSILLLSYQCHGHESQVCPSAARRGTEGHQGTNMPGENSVNRSNRLVELEEEARGIKAEE